MIDAQTTLARDAPATIYNTLTVFSMMHAVVAGTCVLSMVFGTWLGRRWARDGREWQLRRAWCVFVLLWQVAATAWWCSPANFVWSRSLPLHVCDLAGFLVPFALWTQHRWLRSLLYFWAIGLCTQALVTPIEGAGIGQVRFWLFWVGHTQIVGSAVYDVVVLRFVPTWRDYVSATIMMVIYAAIMIPVNVAFEFNYGYVGKKLPDTRTILHALPPWPWRLLALAGIMQVSYLTIWLVWPIGRWVGREFRRRQVQSRAGG